MALPKKMLDQWREILANSPIQGDWEEVELVYTMRYHFCRLCKTAGVGANGYVRVVRRHRTRKIVETIIPTRELVKYNIPIRHTTELEQQDCCMTCFAVQTQTAIPSHQTPRYCQTCKLPFIPTNENEEFCSDNCISRRFGDFHDDY